MRRRRLRAPGTEVPGARLNQLAFYEGAARFLINRRMFKHKGEAPIEGLALDGKFDDDTS